mmetsp:Transcript_13097/g.48954  ORF Transcript_13097/g.48954 Transcript_13097/m.48954 type:complete len:340 (+) Transcript_13097:402-1421(+)
MYCERASQTRATESTSSHEVSSVKFRNDETSTEVLVRTCFMSRSISAMQSWARNTAESPCTPTVSCVPFSRTVPPIPPPNPHFKRIATSRSSTFRNISSALERSTLASAYGPVDEVEARAASMDCETEETYIPPTECASAFAKEGLSEVCPPPPAMCSTRRCATTSSRIPRITAISRRGSPPASVTRRAAGDMAKSLVMGRVPGTSDGSLSCDLFHDLDLAKSKSKPEARKLARPAGVSSMRVAVSRSAWSLLDLFGSLEGGVVLRFFCLGTPTAAPYPIRVNFGSKPAARRASAARCRSCPGDRVCFFPPGLTRFFFAEEGDLDASLVSFTNPMPPMI